MQIKKTIYILSIQQSFPNVLKITIGQKVLPGDTSSVLWNEYLPFDNLPQVMNPKSGFIQNCNNAPYVTTIGKENPDSSSFSKTLGIETRMSNRALRSMELFGNDELITKQEFRDYKYDLKYAVPTWFILSIV